MPEVGEVSSIASPPVAKLPLACEPRITSTINVLAGRVSEPEPDISIIRIVDPNVKYCVSSY